MKYLWRNLHLQKKLSRLKKITLSSALLIVLALNLFTGVNYVTSAAGRPNIIFILTDDLNKEVFNQDTRLQSLLTNQGTKFTRHFASNPLCCPSRVTTLRGQFGHNTGILTNDAASGGGFQTFYSQGLENSTVATWLQDAGYRTALFGKYLNGYPNSAPSNTHIPPGWDRFVSPNGGSPYSQYNYSLNENGTTVSYGSAPSDYLVDVLANKTVTFINNTVTNFPDKPFFIYLAPHIPHGPATPPNRYANVYDGIKAPRTASFNETDVSDKPAWIQNKPLLNATQIANIDDLYEKRRESLLSVADLVGDVIAALQANNQLDNTYIFFTSDNGFHQGQHRLPSGKNTAYVEDIGIPLVVRGPGVPAGRTVDLFTANVDYAPTFAAIAGFTPPSFVDGRSLVPLLQGITPSVWRQALLLEHGAGGAPIFTGLRVKAQVFGPHGGLTYVAYNTGEHEFYDLTADPDQLDNAYSTIDPALKPKLDTWLGSLKNAAGQALRNAEQTVP